MYTGNPFDAPGDWYRANLHGHTTLSDGLRAPDATMSWYREHGYHIAALTDHGRAAASVLLDKGKFLQLGGIEVDGIDPELGLYHLVGLGPSGTVSCRAGQRVPAQEAVDGLREAGAQVILAHPYWSATLSKDLLRLDGLCGLEVYNGMCEVVNAKGLSAVHWDDLLAAGRRLWGFATDDSHWWPGPFDAGLGWVWIKAPALEPNAVLSALEQGHFYASSGPIIYDFRIEGVQAVFRCSPVSSIDFIGPGSSSRRQSAPPGGSLSEACWQLPEGSEQRYVRAACQDHEGGRAWSNPLFLP